MVAVRVSVAALVGEVASDAAAVDVSAVDSVRGGDGVGGIGEGDEGAPARAAGVVVEDDLHGQHFAVALENITHGALVGGESEPADEHRGGRGVDRARRGGPGASARGVGWRSILRVTPRGEGTRIVLARTDVHLVQARVASRVPCPRPNGRLESAAPRDVESDGAEIRHQTSFPRVSSVNAHLHAMMTKRRGMKCSIRIMVTTRSRSVNRKDVVAPERGEEGAPAHEPALVRNHTLHTPVASHHSRRRRHPS